MMEKFIFAFPDRGIVELDNDSIFNELFTTEMGWYVVEETEFHTQYKDMTGVKAVFGADEWLNDIGGWLTQLGFDWKVFEDLVCGGYVFVVVGERHQ